LYTKKKEKEMDDDDDETPTQTQSVSVSQVGLSHTQDKTLADIFGDDSDSDADAGAAPSGTQSRTKTVFYGEYDSLDDSDEDDASNKKSKLLKVNKKSSSASVSKYDSDDDAADKHRSSSSKKGDKDKKKKRKHDDKGKDKGDKSKKRSKRDKSSKSSRDTGDGEVSSGDAYDSGEDMTRTRDDDNFLASDSDDDLRGVTREYDEDNQIFDDERPDEARKGSKTKKPSASSRSHPAEGSSGTKTVKDMDPMSQTLAMIKKPKATEMSETEKARIVTELLRKMDFAGRMDDEMYRQKQPAIYKLQMLKTVESIVEIRALQTTLLEYDILAAFKDWLEPKDDKTLPSLEVRTSIYRMLLSLPCQVDHLKRTAPGKQPIGMTIVALRKHKMETETNKRILKEIMEKWSRPVFGKSVDARNTSGRDSMELRELAAQRFHQAQTKAAVATSPRGSGSSPRAHADGDGDYFGSTANKQTVEGFGRLRASCPQSSGFLFTVQPEYKVVAQAGSEAVVVPSAGKASGAGGGGATGKNELGETREKLLKIMRDNKTVKGGKKQNIKAVGVTLNGRNKA
jgi:transcription factor SPN1